MFIILEKDCSQRYTVANGMSISGIFLARRIIFINVEELVTVEPGSAEVQSFHQGIHH